MTEPVPATPILVTARDAAKLLSISERQLWELSHVRNAIPFVRVGSRSIRYAVRALQDFARGEGAGGHVAGPGQRREDTVVDIPTIGR